ncbi:MAG: HEAT repeat domain-containing protein [Desulfobacterales bacterium]|nr:HEAT repeat domain-containing protein [Desulfobacterales bacterium]
MSRARTLKREIRQVLAEFGQDQAMVRIGGHRPRQTINALISHFYEADALIRWRAVAAAGIVTADLAGLEPESARVIMRRFMWMLNDESGGIGWGAPEAMGAAMARNSLLADEYARVLCSYIDPGQNFLEHPGLQRGLLWGLGELARARPQMAAAAAPHIAGFLYSDDAYHRGIGAWAAGNMGRPENLDRIDALISDPAVIEFFGDWQLHEVSVGELARRAVSAVNRTQKEE